MGKSFNVGEVAVLPSDVGGRLFVCGETVGNRVLQAQSAWSIQHNQPADTMGVHIDNLIKVADRDTAVGLVAVLKNLYEQRRSAVYEVTSRYERLSEKARREAEVYIQEEE